MSTSSCRAVVQQTTMLGHLQLAIIGHRRRRRPHHRIAFNKKQLQHQQYENRVDKQRRKGIVVRAVRPRPANKRRSARPSNETTPSSNKQRKRCRVVHHRTIRPTGPIHPREEEAGKPHCTALRSTNCRRSFAAGCARFGDEIIVGAVRCSARTSCPRCLPTH